MVPSSVNIANSRYFSQLFCSGGEVGYESCSFMVPFVLLDSEFPAFALLFLHHPTAKEGVSLPYVPSSLP